MSVIDRRIFFGIKNQGSYGLKREKIILNSFIDPWCKGGTIIVSPIGKTTRETSSQKMLKWSKNLSIFFDHSSLN